MRNRVKLIICCIIVTNVLLLLMSYYYPLNYYQFISDNQLITAEYVFFGREQKLVEFKNKNEIYPLIDILRDYKYKRSISRSQVSNRVTDYSGDFIDLCITIKEGTILISVWNDGFIVDDSGQAYSILSQDKDELYGRIREYLKNQL